MCSSDETTRKLVVFYPTKYLRVERGHCKISRLALYIAAETSTSSSMPKRFGSVSLLMTSSLVADVRIVGRYSRDWLLYIYTVFCLLSRRVVYMRALSLSHSACKLGWESRGEQLDCGELSACLYTSSFCFSYVERDGLSLEIVMGCGESDKMYDGICFFLRTD